MQRQLWFPQLARQQHSLFSKVTWWPVKHRFIGFCLIYGSCEQKLVQTAQTQFCCSLIPINLLLIAFIWLHLETDHFKNIWSETEMMNSHCYTWYRGLKVKLPQCGSNFTGCLVKWRAPLVDELDLEELALNMKISVHNKHGLIDFSCSK